MTNFATYRCADCWGHVEAPNTGSERPVNCPFCNRTTRGVRRMGEDVTDAEKVNLVVPFTAVLAVVADAMTAPTPWTLFGGWM